MKNFVISSLTFSLELRLQVGDDGVENLNFLSHFVAPREGVPTLPGQELDSPSRNSG